MSILKRVRNNFAGPKNSYGSNSSRFARSRTMQIGVFITVLMVLLVGRLVNLTVIHGEEWSQRAENISVKDVYTIAPRGEILDRYGNVLATNTPSFAVQFSANNMTSDEINRQAQQLIAILEANGDAYYDNFPIVIDENGQFYYTYDKEIQDWLISQGMPTDYTAEQAFNEIRLRQEIDVNLDAFDAQQELIERFNLTLPISVRQMKFTKQIERDNFLKRYGLDTELTAQKAFAALRGGEDSKSKKVFNIDPSLSDWEARKIMVVRDELAAQGFLKYMPAKVAQGVSDKTIVTLEERKTEFPGVEIVAESTRSYPNGSAASHILGYLGQISEAQKKDYEEMGYNANDMIGQEGIEKKYESVLKGTDGVKKVEVDVSGRLVRVISDTAPKKGEDVYLTIDLELQKTAEDALERGLYALRTGTAFESEWGAYKASKRMPNANVGAVVALDVNTSEILAMASYPDFDPNKFAAGISKEDWNSYQGENPRDPLAPRPLLNVAANTAVQPGSTFKMITAMAALESGLSPNKSIRDKGFVLYGNRTYGCSKWNASGGTHGTEDLYRAMAVSCNYYFYCLITNKDWGTGSSLGIPEMGIPKLMDVAQQFGLGLPTGFELPENVRPVPSQDTKYASTKALLSNFLTANAEVYFTAEVADDKELLGKNIETITSWTEENPSRTEIMKRLPDLGIKEDQISTVADKCKSDYFIFATWTTGDEFNLSIGQGENSYTPLMIANYVAAIGNDGVLNKVSVVKGVEGEAKVEKETGVKASVSDKNISIVRKAMEDVAGAEGGGAASVFRRFPVDVAAKTGTAQRSGKVPPLSEMEYIREHLSSIDSSLKWEDVAAEVRRLMAGDPNFYTTEDKTVRQAVRNLSRFSADTVTARIDKFKDDYDEYSWFVCMAPKDDPQIAVAVLLFQGGYGVNGAPIAREIVGQYLGLDKDYTEYQVDTRMLQ